MTVALVVVSATALAQAPQPRTPPGTTMRPAGKTAAKPTIVLVHGAFADGSSWDKVVPLLLAKGYPVVAVHEPMVSAAEDIDATKRAIDAAPGPVILVGHSYGGFVITEAGMNDKVIGLVYVAAFAPDAEQSINDVGKAVPPPAWQKTAIIDKAGFATLRTDDVMKNFAQDLPAADQRLIAVKQAPIPLKSFDVRITQPAWKSKPSWYVRAANDRMIDPGLQTSMATKIRATTKTLQSSHVPMLSQPRQVADVILQAAEGAPSATAQR
ncbi:MAG TPA: alpha/beta hydrolase [Kofleriaceae bacterium]|nr:alpha/beta hydrolase [Kofleriaceae bacterium]